MGRCPLCSASSLAWRPTASRMLLRRSLTYLAKFTNLASSSRPLCAPGHAVARTLPVHLWVLRCYPTAHAPSRNPRGIFRSLRTHNTHAMAHNDNKPTERRLIYATDLLPKDLCDIERYFQEHGASEFVYDAKLDVFCFPEDGRFAFCDEFADWKRLWERGYLDF